MWHDCVAQGFHRFGVLKWIDRSKFTYMRVCKTCPYIYMGQLIPDPNDSSAAMKSVWLNKETDPLKKGFIEDA